MPREPKLIVGAKVHYIPFTGAHESNYENGIIKSMCEDPGFCFVVYHCAGDWDNYTNYTGQRTAIEQLKYGWVQKDQTLEHEETKVR